jgi:hypothetical protein
MSHVARLQLSTRVSDVTGTSSLRKLPRPRSSMFRFRSTPEPSHDDDVELQQLLPPFSRDLSGDPNIPTESDSELGSDHLTTSLDNLLETISGTRGSDTEDWEGANDTGDWEGANNAFTEPPPHRRVVHALNTLIQDIDQQDHTPPRWSHVRPWLLSAPLVPVQIPQTRHSPSSKYLQP